MSTGASWPELFDRIGAAGRAARFPRPRLATAPAPLVLVAAAGLLAASAGAAWAQVTHDDWLLRYPWGMGAVADGHDWLGGLRVAGLYVAAVAFLVAAVAGRRAFAVAGVVAGMIVLVSGVAEERPFGEHHDVFAGGFLKGPQLALAALLMAAGAVLLPQRTSRRAGRRTVVVAVCGLLVIASAHLTGANGPLGDFQTLWGFDATAALAVSAGGAAIVLAAALAPHPALAVLPAFVLTLPQMSEAREGLVWSGGPSGPLFVSACVVAAAALAWRRDVT